jgi:Zn-dependent peptidase ImmA (M78 family)
MALRRGFKKEANDYSRDFRKELDLQPHSPLCPHKLASLLDIPIVSLSEVNREFQLGEHFHHVTEVDQKCFSALTVFDRLRRLIVHNDSHHPKRQASNIAHELSHAILQHPPTQPFSDYGCRNFDKEIEDEANWLGPALLISEEAALYIVKKKIGIDQASELYGVTKDIIRMRINVTGAKKRMNCRAS